MFRERERDFLPALSTVDQVFQFVIPLYGHSKEQQCGLLGIKYVYSDVTLARFNIILGCCQCTVEKQTEIQIDNKPEPF